MSESATSALIVGTAPAALWSLDNHERLRRALRRLRIAEVDRATAAEGPLLVLDGACLFEERVLSALAEVPGCVLLDTDGESIAGGCVDPAQADALAQGLGSAPGTLDGDLAALPCRRPVEVAGAYQERLRKRSEPFVARITAGNARALENRLYAIAYKGVTDLVTKWAWPLPARAVVRWCAARGIAPNTVTWLSVVLTVLAGLAFLEGHFWWGLLAGWGMTFLDTVDGKLARVTLTSSRFGDVLDHGLDILHPPFWYAAWGLGLAAWTQPFGLSVGAVIGWIVAGYIGGRLAEGAFQVWCAPFSIFSWRPFDSWFRLVTARRNPNMLMMTAALAAGRPDIGLLAVMLWHGASTLLLWARVGQGLLARRGGALSSWIARVGTEISPDSLSARLFAR